MSAGAHQTQPPGPRRKGAAKVSPARSAAFEILRRVEDDGAFASVLLAAVDEEMTPQDRALCYELVMGTLRWQLWLDQLIEYYAGRNVERLDAPVRRALRLGLYQLRFLTRIPASAAVNESVNLLRRARVRSAESFVNAVLRHATREPNYNPASKITDALERIAVETSHPVWLIERWTNAFGAKETAAFARANDEAPPTAFRLVLTRATEGRDVLEELRAAGGILETSRIAPDAWRIVGAGALVRRLAGEGLIYLQDEASQLVAHVLDAQTGERVLDSCAAPGSKSTHIAARVSNRALIVAGDLYEHRLRTVLETSARQRASAVSVIALNAEKELPFVAGSFDRVLVDAPCSGTGTLRRNPEIRWRISTSDILDLSARQKRILFNASEMVKRGGRIVYSTCSVEPEENEIVVAAFLKDRPTFRQIPVSVSAELQGSNGVARTWPHRDGADGFFIAAFVRFE